VFKTVDAVSILFYPMKMHFVSKNIGMLNSRKTSYDLIKVLFSNEVIISGKTMT